MCFMVKETLQKAKEDKSDVFIYLNNGFKYAAVRVKEVGDDAFRVRDTKEGREFIICYSAVSTIGTC